MGMELLDLLESRISELLDEVTLLRDENRSLLEQLAAGRHELESLPALQAELAQEKENREQTAARVDALIRRIQTSLDEQS